MARAISALRFVVLESEKGEVLLRGVGTLRYSFPPNASAQWQPGDLATYTKRWFLGAGFLGAPPTTTTTTTTITATATTTTAVNSNNNSNSNSKDDNSNSNSHFSYTGFDSSTI